MREQRSKNERLVPMNHSKYKDVSQYTVRKNIENQGRKLFEREL